MNLGSPTTPDSAGSVETQPIPGHARTTARRPRAAPTICLLISIVTDLLFNRSSDGFYDYPESAASCRLTVHHNDFARRRPLAHNAPAPIATNTRGGGSETCIRRLPPSHTLKSKLTPPTIHGSPPS